MVTKIITNIKEFAELRSDWESLHSKINGTIFQSFDWNYHWWNIYSQNNTELLIITTWQNDELIGILPLFREFIKIGPIKFKRARFLCVYQAYGDYEPLVSSEYKHLVLEEFAVQLQKFLKDKILNWVSFFGYSQNSESMSILIRHFKRNNFITIQKTNAVTKVVMQLPSNWEEYLNILSINERTMLQRRIKSLKKNEVELEVLNNGNIKPYDFKEFVHLHTSAWGRKGFPGYFKSSERFEKFLATILTKESPKNIKKIYFLKKNNRRFASVLAFFSYPICYFYLSGMEQNFELSRYSPGKVLLSYVIKDAIENGYKIFDFQGGKETYKYQLGGKSDYYSKVDIFNINLITPILLCLYYIVQFRQVLLTFFDYSGISRFAHKLFANLKKQ